MKTYNWSPGTKYGKLTIDSELEYEQNPSGRNIPYAWCFCDCGTRKRISISSLRSYPGGRNTISCGCYYRDERRAPFTHQQSKTRLYAIHKGMIQRCYNPNRKSYDYYGGKGILICDAWLADFLAFKYWSESNGYCEPLQIDRIDPSGNYCPENCRWVTDSENTAHKNARYLTMDGETKTMNEWCADIRCSICRKTLRKRLARGMNVKEAITSPGFK